MDPPKVSSKGLRGLQQGDPLFPPLFLIVGEALSRMLNKGEEEDSVLVDNLHFVIRCFEVVSGLKVNLTKSKLCGINIEPKEVSDFAQKMGCAAASFLSSFVGLPLCTGVPPKSAWDKVINRFESYLTKWKCRFLSRGGRLTLIKAALSNLPVHLMSLFRCPPSKLKSIDKLMRDFFWNDKSD
ncbi:uncharacterized protein LOC131226996 [Magnolia sinica]|uniref:uncharacterized protein LOC131226996 n=1 Tax=Magnolia sinica TaxID=86752 RepID=UPI00265971F2|nr:uncharacterized protein LOC131226996 [Magnolia sinica]